ncbi:MAG TPA: circularly permuted type 2 ATP-grasp protein [Bryobacteraceae bacterium]|nr:circularly permuted type 2 ATP-grasp protein [Bryobacteraceae bacterium]
MTQLDEAIARYHRILESEPYRDLRWVKNLQEQMEARQLSAGGRLLCPFLRPNFVTQKQYDNLVKTGEALISAVDRMLKMALASPQLLSRMQLFPAEKMLAAIDPGYEMSEVSAQLDLQIQNGSLHVLQYNADALSGAAYAEGLSDLFYDCPPVKEFRRRYNLTRVGGKKPFLDALLKAYGMFANSMAGAPVAAKKSPNIAILEFRSLTGRSEYEIFRDYFREEGFATELVSPDQLEYRNGVLRASSEKNGPFDIDLIYRRVSAQEFLLRFNLNHALVQAYRDHKVCIVNSFRSELSHKKAMFALLTDETLTAKFPPNERKAITEHVPWTRVVKAGKTIYHEQAVELLDFIRENREKLVLRPNDEYSDMHSFIGYEHDEGSWARAIREAQRSPYVVQERVPPSRSVFPLMSYGHLEFKEMQVDVQPQAFLGKVAGCSSYVSSAGPGSYSPASGIAPTFIIDPKS